MALINTILADKLPVLQHDEKGYYYIDADKRVDTYLGSLIVFHGEYFQISFNDLKWHKIGTSKMNYCEELTSGE